MNHEEAWLEALRADLGKPSVEGYVSELGVLFNEIDDADRHFAGWMQPKRLNRLLPGGLEKVKFERQSYGAILIISPWNSSLNLSIMPRIGALAAGNSCFLKPSGLAPATAQVLEDLGTDYFLPEEVTVVQGDGSVAEILLELPWNRIFFTGSKRVGAIVHQAATRQLDHDNVRIRLCLLPQMEE